MITWTNTKFAAAAIALGTIAGAGGIVTVHHAAAQSAPPAHAALTEAPNSAGVTVANAPPVIVKTIPQSGDDQVDPNLSEIKITFSKDMHDGSWSWAQMSDDTFPKSTGKIHYEADKRTCVMPVKLEPGHTYVLLLNKPPYTNFVDTGHRQAIEYWLAFHTKK